MEEKKKEKRNIILLDKDNETIVINGKRNNLYEIPASGLAIISVNINKEVARCFRNVKKITEEGAVARKYAFVGLASAISSFLATGDFKLLLGSVGVVFGLTSLFQTLKTKLKQHKLKKEITRYDDLNDLIGSILLLKMYSQEDISAAIPILEEAAQEKRKAIKELLSEQEEPTI